MQPKWIKWYHTYSESKHLHCKQYCMCGWVCVCVCVCVCVRKTETRSPHGGIPLLEETPLCSAPSSQQDIMGTAAGLFSLLWKNALSPTHVIRNWNLPRPFVGIHFTREKRLNVWQSYAFHLRPKQFVWGCLCMKSDIRVCGASHRAGSPHAATHADRSHIHTPTSGWKHPREKEPWVIRLTAVRFSPSPSQPHTMWSGHVSRCCTLRTLTHPAPFCLKRSHSTARKCTN